MSNTPLITDWIMVVITTIYVVATICIWLANKKAADASRAQLEESQRQFKESSRLSVLPYLKIGAHQGASSCDYSVRLYDKYHTPHLLLYSVVLSNIGSGTATDITCSLESNEGQSEGEFPVLSLQSGKEDHIAIRFKYPNVTIEKDSIQFVSKYSDVLGNSYKQIVLFEVRFDQKSKVMSVVRFTTYPPEREK